MITITQQEAPIEAEKGIVNNFDFASCLFGTMKLKGIKRFKPDALSNYISVLFESSEKIRNYFPNVDGNFTIIETISLLKLDDEMKLGRKYDTFSFDIKRAYELSKYVTKIVDNQRLNIVIADMVDNYITNQEIFDSCAIDSKLVKVNKTK